MDETMDSPAISALVKNGYRWKNVSIWFPENSWGASKLTLATKFPLLERLDLYHVKFPMDTNIDAPKLFFLSLCSSRTTLSNENNLREIEINDYRGSMTHYDCLSMFRRCLALEKATIYMLYESHCHRDSDRSMVTPTALRHLRIRSGFKNLQLILDNMTAPALKRLELLTEHNFGAVSLHNLLPFIKRSKCALVSLLLDGHYSGFDALLNCLERQPHLEQLSVVDPCLNGELMNHLVKPSLGHTSHFYICPKLTMLAFTPGHVQNPTQIKSLVEVISSRNQNTTGGLRTIVVRQMNMAKATELDMGKELRETPEMAEYMKKGLKVETSWPCN
ncbi:hypothetical protein BD410DRAFT_390641 [Rickenella mellea]|uniref:F-box domain-containing protein n=1 Tax=Rickenella mellea TaxID=50990 RepID=A0A4Y7PYG8_9AGAM|nr:hypothetical protein BD410DRAFT_390641 [Rickenella mellea]